MLMTCSIILNLSSQAGGNINKRVYEASLYVSYHVAKAGKAHTIAETLIKQCTVDVVETTIGEKFSNIIKTATF
jgi:ABC-type uncharacterized transport system substrate-binding protein